jgi:two-component system sensor histidine kinase CpxA
MQSLFLRVFLWFWLAMAAVVVVLVVTSPLFTRSRPGIDRWHRSAEEWSRARLERTTAAIAERGAEAMPMRRGQGRGRGGPPPPARVFVFDDMGVEIHGEEVPEEVSEFAARTANAGEEITERSGTLYLMAHPVTDPDGRRLVVVAAHHAPPRLVQLIEPKALAWRLGVMVVVVGVLSFWLAKYLSSPVAPLREATNRLSNGELSARVQGRVSRRRDEIGGLARDFDAMAERIEGLVESQQRLLRDVSHELRSPLARLSVALELARSKTGHELTAALDRIEVETGRLDELISQLLLLERLAAGGAEGEREEIDLVRLVAEVVEDAGYEAAADACEVRVTCSDILQRIVASPHLLRSALENILRNAVRHTPSGTAVEVSVTGRAGAVEITVRDQGPGVADDELEQIFDPFYRTSEARDRSSGGTGLGLAIAAGAIRAHGGSVEASNHPDGGLVVMVSLPRRS